MLVSINFLKLSFLIFVSRYLFGGLVLLCGASELLVLLEIKALIFFLLFSLIIIFVKCPCVFSVHFPCRLLEPLFPFSSPTPHLPGRSFDLCSGSFTTDTKCHRTCGSVLVRSFLHVSYFHFMITGDTEI
jgi:hypothetical protein